MFRIKYNIVFVFLCLSFFSCTMDKGVDEKSQENIIAELKIEIEDNILKLDYDSVIDSYCIKAKYNEYDVIIDVTDNDYSEWNYTENVMIPYSVMKNNKLLYSSTVKFENNNLKKGGILFSFDDYFSCWNKYLPYFVKYNIKATFFCYGNYSRFGNFAQNVQNSGLEVGYHTLTHKALIMCDTKDEFIKEAIEPLAVFRDKYIHLDSFAFPNGLYLPYQMESLLEYYKIVRLFDNHFRLYSIEEIAKNRIIFSQSIDKNKFVDDKDFRNNLIKRILLSQITGKIYPCTTHYILSEGEAVQTEDYTISENNLIWFFETINALNVKTYCYKNIYTYMY